ncbi:unnamed protein product [Durusdinium trenchii]|uniref:Uncharacterized protein n=5 Tax=Durusdinium trenchii TaxID=1381693 RepID=A0ABP0L4G2_9DINO
MSSGACCVLRRRSVEACCLRNFMVKKPLVCSHNLPLIPILFARPIASEAPPGAVPSQGTEAWYADYDLSLRPEDAGAGPLSWRLSAWQFQEDLIDFYNNNGRPPLNPAYFVVATLPEALQMQILQECPGLMVASSILIAQARQSAGDCPQAAAVFRQMLRWAYLLSSRDAAFLAPFDSLVLEEEQIKQLVTQASAMLPGWSIEVAMQRFLQAHTSCRNTKLPSHRCEDAKLDIVVAVCNEDLSWLESFAPARFWVYAKCGLQGHKFLPCANYEELPNLAMESLAYATHMERHYETLADFTLFVQGSPFEHASQRLVEDTVSAVQEGLYDVPFLHMNSRRFLSGSSFCLRDLYTRLMESPAQVPEAFGSYCCSQFMVRRDRIQARPRALYHRIRSILLGEVPLACAQDVKYDPRPRIAVSALFEHLWHVVLGESPVLPTRRSDQRLPLFARVDVIEGALPDVLLSQM